MKTWLWRILVWLDQGANVIFGPLLNALTHADVAHFGYPDETLSSVFGKNVRQGQCTLCKRMCRFLNWIDPRHCTTAIEEDEGNVQS